MTRRICDDALGGRSGRTCTSPLTTKCRYACAHGHMRALVCLRMRMCAVCIHNRRNVCMLAVCRDLSTNRYPHSDNTMDAESVLKCAEQAAGAAGAMHMCERLQHVSLGLGGRPANAEEVARAANTARACERLQHASLGLGGRPANAEEAAGRPAPCACAGACASTCAQGKSAWLRAGSATCRATAT